MRNVLEAVVMACDVVGFLLLLSRRVPLWRCAGVFAVGNGAVLVGDAMARDLPGGCGAAVICAACAVIWWKDGGGDGTRRRWRAVRKAFQGVRRTAPAAGGGS